MSKWRGSIRRGWATCSIQEDWKSGSKRLTFDKCRAFGTIQYLSSSLLRLVSPSSLSFLLQDARACLVHMVVHHLGGPRKHICRSVRDPLLLYRIQDRMEVGNPTQALRNGLHAYSERCFRSRGGSRRCKRHLHVSPRQVEAALAQTAADSYFSLRIESKSSSDM
jgi:hypothetical protein